MEQPLLTPLELKVMNILWRLKKAYVKEIIGQWSEDKEPKYNTISTIVRILEDKKYVDHEAFGRSHQYFPIVSKGKYQQRLMKNVVENVFSGSLTGMLSSLLDSDKVSAKELDELRSLIDQSDSQ